jgi:hypothetical protein
VRNEIVPTITLVVSRDALVERIVEHSRLAAWNGHWAIQFDPSTGRHDWYWEGRFPPVGSNADLEARPGWSAVVLPRVDATKLMVDARKDRVEDWVWQASAEGTLDGWIEAGDPARRGLRFKFT